MRGISKIIVPIVIFIFLGGGGLILNQSFELPEPGLTPDSPFYFLDTLLEKISLIFTFSAQGKAKKALKFAEEKLAEMEIMANKDRIKDLEKANRNYNLYLDLAHQEANQIVDLISLISQRIFSQQRTISQFLSIQMKDELRQGEKIELKIEKKLDQPLYTHEEKCKSPFEIYDLRGNQLFLRECAIRNQKECQEGELKTVEKVGRYEAWYECVQLEESYIWDQKHWLWRENLCGDLPYKEWIRRELEPGEYKIKFRVFNNENCADPTKFYTPPDSKFPSISLPSQSFSFELRKEFKILGPSPYEGWEIFLHPYYKYEMRYPPELNLAENREFTPWFSSPEINFGISEIIDSFGDFRKDWEANYPGRESEFETVNLVNAYALLSPLVVKADIVEREIVFVGDFSSKVFLFKLKVKRNAVPEKLEIARKMIESFVFPDREDFSQYLPPEQTITLEKIVQIGEIEGIQILRKAHDFHIKGDLMYITDTVQGLVVFDISDLTSPKLIGRLKPSEKSFYDAIFVGDQYAFITQGVGGMDIVDISDPSQPKKISHFKTKESLYGRAVAAKDDTVYLGGDGSSNDASLIGVDISDPLSPQQFEFPFIKKLRGTRGFIVEDMKILEDRLYITGRNDGAFVFDISNPKQPSLISTPYGVSSRIRLDVSEDLIALIGGKEESSNYFVVYLLDPEKGINLDVAGFAADLKIHPPWDVKIENHNYMFIIEGYLKEQYLEVFDLRTFLWIQKIPPTLHRLLDDYLHRESESIRESIFQKEIKIHPRKIDIIGDKLYLLYASEGVEVYKIKIEQVP